jgi:hypothetical protein
VPEKVCVIAIWAAPERPETRFFDTPAEAEAFEDRLRAMAVPFQSNRGLHRA